MDRKKRRGDLPCQRMELTHSEDASKLCHNSKLFLVKLPVASGAAGFQFRHSNVSGCHENQQSQGQD